MQPILEDFFQLDCIEAMGILPSTQGEFLSISQLLMELKLILLHARRLSVLESRFENWRAAHYNIHSFHPLSQGLDLSQWAARSHQIFMGSHITKLDLSHDA